MARPEQIIFYLEAAKKMDMNTKRVPGTNLFEFQHNNKTLHIHEGYTTLMSAIAHIYSSEKHYTKALLKNADINTQAWVEFYRGSTTDDVLKYSKKLNYPVVVKPARGIHGENVFMGINTPEEIVPLVKQCQALDKSVLVEEMFSGGTEMRLLATREKFLAAAIREPASLTGNGKHTVQELLNEKNSDPRRTGKDPVLYEIIIDDIAKKLLAKQKVTLNDVPKKGNRIWLRSVSNLGAGGDSVDVTEEIHPSIKELAVKMVQAIPGLPFAGMDFITKNYAKPQSEVEHTVLEINCRPMITMHYHPYKGTPRDVAAEILEYLFSQL